MLQFARQGPPRPRERAYIMPAVRLPSGGPRVGLRRCSVKAGHAALYSPEVSSLPGLQNLHCACGSQAAKCAALLRGFA